MSAQIKKSGFFEAASGHLVIIDCGFVPDFVTLLVGLDNTNPNLYFWWRQQYLSESADQVGALLTGSTGVVTVPNTAAAGINPYTTVNHGVWLPSPTADGQFTFRTPTTWNAGTDNYNGARARSTVQAGDAIWPTTKNGFVYELVTAGGVGGTEPTWGTIPGGDTADTNNTWRCRIERPGVYSPKGFQVGASVMTDGDRCYFNAELHLDKSDLGDGENLYPGTF